MKHAYAFFMETLVSTRKSIEALYPKICEGALAGLTDREIAQYCGITSTKLKRWLNSDEELALMVAEVRDGTPAKLVEASLLKEAMGYNYPETKVIKENGVVVKEEITVKHARASTDAAKFFLKNRGENWRDKVEVDTSQEIRITFDPALANV